MMLSHILFEEPIVFRDGYHNLLVIENQREMAKLTRELSLQSLGLPGRFRLTDGMNSVNIRDSVKVVFDPFSLDANYKPIINRLYSQMRDDSFDGDNYVETDRLLQSIESYVQHISGQQSVQLTHSDRLDPADLFRAMEVRFDTSNGSLLDSLCDFVSICKEYTRTRLFVFINLKCFLSDEDLEQFYSHSAYNKLDLLFIEGRVSNKNQREIVRIIDKDLCEIYQHRDNLY